MDKKIKFNKNRNLSKTRNQAHKTLSIPLFWRNFSTSNKEMYITEEQEIQNIENYNLFCDMLSDDENGLQLMIKL